MNIQTALQFIWYVTENFKSIPWKKNVPGSFDSCAILAELSAGSNHQTNGNCDLSSNLWLVSGFALENHWVANQQWEDRVATTGNQNEQTYTWFKIAEYNKLHNIILYIYNRIPVIQVTFYNRDTLLIVLIISPVVCLVPNSVALTWRLYVDQVDCGVSVSTSSRFSGNGSLSGRFPAASGSNLQTWKVENFIEYKSLASIYCVTNSLLADQWKEMLFRSALDKRRQIEEFLSNGSWKFEIHKAPITMYSQSKLL